MPPGPKKGEGPEPLLTDEVVYRTAVDAFGRGLYAPDVAAILGLNERTVQGWIKKGKRGDGEIYIRFFRDISRANAKLLDGRLAKMETHGETQWQALWKLIQAQRPGIYGDQRKELTEIKKRLEAIEASRVPNPGHPVPPQTSPPGEDGGDED